MYASNTSKFLVGIAFAGTVALLTATTGAQAQSYCLRGGGSVIPQCGFATIEQCLSQGAGFGVCNPSASTPESVFSGANANAKMMKPVSKRHVR